MTGPTQHPASNSESRKRMEPPVSPHAKSIAETLDDCARTLAAAVEDTNRTGLDDRDTGYIDGWNAAARYFSASFVATAQIIRDNGSAS